MKKSVSWGRLSLALLLLLAANSAVFADEAPELDRSTFTAQANMYRWNGDEPDKALGPDDGSWVPAVDNVPTVGAWLRVDFASRHELEKISYQAESHFWTREFDVYVSDNRGPAGTTSANDDKPNVSHEDAVSYWGQPVISGFRPIQYSSDPQVVYFAAPVTGRYMILRVVEPYGGEQRVSVSELKFWGTYVGGGEDAPELDRTPFTAEANSYQQDAGPASVFSPDGLWLPSYLTSVEGNWIRIDFGRRHELEKITHQCWEHHRLYRYEIYVSENKGPENTTSYNVVKPKLTRAEAVSHWGEPVAQGAFDASFNPQTVAFDTPALGRYMVLRVASPTDHYGENRASIRELRFWGTEWAGIDEFVVRDVSTGNPYHTQATTVDCGSLNEMVHTGRTATGYMVTETDFGEDGPAVDHSGWLVDKPATYQLVPEGAVAEGLKTIYAWVRDDATPPNVYGKSDWIVYSTAAPQLVGEPTFTAGSFSIGVEWRTDAPAVGWVEYREAGTGGEWLISPASADFQTTLHAVNVTGLQIDTAYSLILRSSAAQYGPYTVSTTPPPPTEENVTWTDGGGDGLWSNGRNWTGVAGSCPPANPTPATVSFLKDTAYADWSIVDPQNLFGGEITDSWTVKNLHVDMSPSHTISLYDDAAKTLIVDGMLTVEEGKLSMTDGALGFESDTSLGSIKIGNRTTWGTLRTSELDLTATTAPGNVLHTKELLIANVWYHTGRIMISETTGLGRIQIDSMVRMATCYDGNGGGQQVARVGDPVDWKLPAGIDVQLGTPEQACTVQIAHLGYQYSIDGSIIARDGGDFWANLSSVDIGQWNGKAGVGHAHTWQRGTLDLRAMASCDATFGMVRVGTIGQEPTNPAQGPLDPQFREEVNGILALPPGTASANSVTLGHPYPPHPDAKGLLHLNGTLFIVSSGLTVHQTGIVETIVNGKSAGLDIVSGFTPVLNGKISINFAAPQDEGEAGEYWGLRWAGAHQLALQTMLDEGRLTIDDTEGGGTAKIFYDGTYTYVALREQWLQAVAQDITAEIQPPNLTTVVVGLDDIDAVGKGPEVVTRSLSCPQDLTPEDPAIVTVSSSVPADFHVTLTVVYTGGVESSAVGTLSLVLANGPSDSDMTWTGGAALRAMPRREWALGANWSGGLFPNNPTAANLTFGIDGSAGSAGVVTSLVDPQDVAGVTGGAADRWQVRNLTLDAPGKFHTLRLYDDVAGAPITLNVRNRLYIIEGQLDITDGVLDLVTETTVVPPEGDPYTVTTIGDLRIAGRQNPVETYLVVPGTGILDLSSSATDTLHVNRLEMAEGLNGAGPSWTTARLWVGESLNRLQVDTLLSMATNTDWCCSWRRARIEDPARGDGLLPEGGRYPVRYRNANLRGPDGKQWRAVQPRSIHKGQRRRCVHRQCLHNESRQMARLGRHRT